VFGVNEAFFGGSSLYCWLKEATQIVLRPETGGWFGVKSGKRTAPCRCRWPTLTGVCKL
jgi:hypothetical protein